MTGVDIINFDQTILELKEAISEEEDEKEKRRLQRLLSKFVVLKGIEQRATKTKTDVKKAMSITCYKNLGYCCGLAKDCYMRDGCRQALGVDNETYVRIKEKMIWEMLQYLSQGKKGEGQ
jgi:predicted metal-binding transcription factor (methanogenesis marker protein 9)